MHDIDNRKKGRRDCRLGPLWKRNRKQRACDLTYQLLLERCIHQPIGWVLKYCLEVGIPFEDQRSMHFYSKSFNIASVNQTRVLHFFYHGRTMDAAPLLKKASWILNNQRYDMNQNDMFTTSEKTNKERWNITRVQNKEKVQNT